MSNITTLKGGIFGRVLKTPLTIMMVVAAAAAIFFCSGATASPNKKIARQEAKRFKKFITILSENHIDEFNFSAMVDGAIEQILEQCDPYSRYLPHTAEVELEQMLAGESVEECYSICDSVGVIRLSLFTRNTGESILAHYNALKCPTTLILDLRGNIGGLVSEAIKTASLFLENDVQIFAREGRTIPRRNFKTTESGKLIGVRLIVLIDQKTASASEIVVGALQDHDRAIVVGERSFGKGIILKRYKLDSRSSALIAIAQYFTPSGRAIQSPYSGRNIDRSRGAIEPEIVYQSAKIIDYEEYLIINNEINHR